MRWEAADRAAKMAEKAGDLIGLRDAAIVAVASDALLRVSEVAALEVADVDSGGADGGDPAQQDGSGGGGLGAVPGEADGGAYWGLAASLRRLAAGALFRAVNKSGRVYGEHLTTRTIRLIITRRARAAGVEGRPQRPQPAGRQRPESGHRRRLAGRDAGGRALAVARTCRGVTRKGNWRDKAPWQDCGMARTGRRAIRPLVESPEQALPRAGSGIGGMAWYLGVQKTVPMSS